VLKSFKPESQTKTTAVFHLKEVLSNSVAAATLVADENPVNIPSSFASRRVILIVLKFN
jgi:hypothetical protein